MAEQYVVSARKYRPKTFDEVVGQEGITETLEKAIKQDKIGQAFLFCGPRGVGKTTCARILARVINEKHTEDLKDQDFAFNIFELDAASNNSVDDIRSLTEQVQYPPQIGKYKVYIIDEVHMLSQAAFNAFLKTLEEPPAHAIFILATTEKHKIIPTILSRCQIFDFRRIEVAETVTHLQDIVKQEGLKADADALHVIGQKADGALRDALTIFDQISGASDGNITLEAVNRQLNVLDYETYFKLTESLVAADFSAAMVLFDGLLQKGFDGHQFLIGLARHFRDLLVSKDARTAKLLEVPEGVQNQYHEQSNQINNSDLLEYIEILNQADIQYKNSKNQRLLVELSLIRLCRLHGADEKKK